MYDDVDLAVRVRRAQAKSKLAKARYKKNVKAFQRSEASLQSPRLPTQPSAEPRRGLVGVQLPREPPYAMPPPVVVMPRPPPVVPSVRRAPPPSVVKRPPSAPSLAARRAALRAREAEALRVRDASNDRLRRVIERRR